MLSVQQAGISLKLSLGRARLEKVIEKAKIQAKAFLPIVQQPVFEQYYEGPEEVSMNGIMQHLPRLLQEEYQLLLNSKLQQVRQHLQSQRAKKAESLQLAIQIESAIRLRQLASKKNDLIEKHVLVDVKIQSERHRLEVCHERKQHLRSCKEVGLENQLADIDRNLDKQLRKATQELQQLVAIKEKEIDSHWRTAGTVLRLQNNNKVNDMQQADNIRRQQATSLWADYNQKSAELQKRLNHELQEQQNFISALMGEYEQQSTLQQLDFKNTVKSLTAFPEPASQQQMEKHLHRIDRLKRRLQHLRKESSQSTPQYRKIKRQLKSHIDQFEQMMRVREQLKKTLRI